MKKNNGNKNESEKRSFFRSESATATVIGAVLLLGIIFSVFAIIRIDAVPEWKNDAEYSHMNNVGEDMADLKSKIDMMSTILALSSSSSYINASNPSSLAPPLVMNVPFHMGGGDIPFIDSIKSSGNLAVNKDRYVMSIIVNPEDDEPYFKSINCGTINYSSQNRYYVDQVFSYENGALILKQKDQAVMMLYPSILFSNVSTNENNVSNYDVSINVIRVLQKPYIPPDIISSNSRCSLRLTGIGYEPLYDSEIKSSGNIDRFILTITTEYPKVWELYFEKIMENAGIGQEKYTLMNESKNVRLIFPKISDPASENESTSEKESTLEIKRLYISETAIKAEPEIGLN